MENLAYIILVIFIAAIVTWFTRAIPFLVFGNRALPEKVKYLGGVLPPAIMVILVVYCLRNINFKNINNFLPEIIACAVVIISPKLKLNMYMTIILSTLCYMLLIRII
ncbi:AzlD domain-containing protein [uncultured Fusobacterium sp.]|uniref:branched-chain amino acid transporter permease n=1 Tax=uncultured Fusobacterium sp. TaxID=159267 RepID=UPI0025DC6146|nr:AzlD domain-containing protein [uncultured Fusobacterium sp.]